MLYHLLNSSNFCLCLSSVADYSKTGIRPQPQQNATLFYPLKGQCGLDTRFWVRAMIIFRGSYFNLISRLKMSISSFLTEIWDPYSFPVGFVRPESCEARCWTDVKFILRPSHPHSASHGSICLTYGYKKILSFPLFFSSRFAQSLFSLLFFFLPFRPFFSLLSTHEYSFSFYC